MSASTSSQRARPPSIAEQLGAFVAATADADLPPKAVDYAQMLIASTLASAALGSTLESTRIVRGLEVDRGGRPDATLWFGAAERVPIAAAARVNALMSDAAASDDSDLRNIVHSGTTACAAALAVAEWTGASGEDVLAAIVLGHEVAGRINTAMLNGLQSKGFHGCIVASFAGAVAAARLMKLDATQVAHTIALTATSVGGLHVAAAGSVAREYHAGLAAMLGVYAAQAAARGFVPEINILEMQRGFFESYGNEPDIPGVTRELGRNWSILTDMGIKLVPGGSPFHAIAEAAADAARSGNVVPDEVETITVSIRYRYKGPQFPTDLIGIAHSPVYFAAAGVADREYTWAHAFEDKINDPRIRGLLGKVRLVDPPTENVERYKSGAVVTVTTKDGRSSASTVYAPRGAAILGIAWADVEAKYRALAPYAKLSGNNLEASLQVIRHFRDVKKVSELVGLLR
ncbi:MAG: MmgE/PrpD family protein [Burkholderiales bacterium]|nr:MmgE/PrpD family protein [Burkholderiales bacterium]